MAASYISELGDKLSHGVANTEGSRVKILAPVYYTDGSNHPSIATALAGKAASTHPHDITRTADTTNGDKLQIGTGTAVNVTNSAHAASADKLTTARKTYVTLGTANTTTTRDWSGDTTIPVNGTLAVGNGGTGLTTATNVNSVVIGNSSSATGALQTVATASGAFYATGANAKPAFGTLPVAQGGTGQTSLANVSVGSAIKATGDGDGNTISSTYLKLSGGTMTGTINTPVNDVALNFRPVNGYHTTMSYQSSGNEALVFASTSAATSFMFVNGENSVSNHNSNRWQSLTPGLQIKNNCVSIGKLIGQNVTPTYKLEVNGTVRGESYNINDACTMQYNSSTLSVDFVF